MWKYYQIFCAWISKFLPCYVQGMWKLLKILLLSHKLFSLCMESIIIKYGVHMSLLSHWNWVLWVKFHLDDYFNVHTYCLLQNLRFLLVHSFSAPSLAIHGEGVGETDIRRPLDPARPWALLLGTPRCSDQAVTTAASWVDGCAAPPAEMASWSVWWCCETEGQLF